MSEKTIPDQIKSLGRYYEQAQQGNLILRAAWLLEAAAAVCRGRKASVWRLSCPHSSRFSFGGFGPVF